MNVLYTKETYYRSVNQAQIPVLLVGFNRPELLMRRVLELRENDLSLLYISIDGNHTIDIEMENCLESISQLFESEKSLKILRSDENMGLAKHITTRISQLLEEHESIIVLEDDIKIGNNFIQNMNLGLKNLDELSLRGVVSGFSAIMRPRNMNIKNRWRRTPYFNCWGWVCTRDVWKDYKLDISEEDLNHELGSSMTWRELSNWQQFLWLSRFIKIQRTPFHTWDIQFQYHCFKNSYINLAPILSITDNEGFNDSRSAHTIHSKPRWWMKSNIYERLTDGRSLRITEAVFTRIIEPLTTAGDSRVIRIRNKYRN